MVLSSFSRRPANCRVSRCLCVLCRLTDLLPFRKLPFSRDDDVIGLTETSGRETMSSFAYNADMPYALVVALSMSLPVVVVSIFTLDLGHLILK